MSEARREFDAVLFDFDGVIVDSEPVHYECWRELLSERGIDIDWEYYRSDCIGVAEHPMLEAIARRAGRGTEAADLIGLYPRKKEMFRAKMSARMPLAPGIGPLVRSLSAYRLAVVSSSGRAEVEPVLEQAGLRASLDALVCGMEAGALKPEPEPYLLAAKLAGARRPLVVEDSDAGERSGRAAGFEVLRVESAGEVASCVAARLGAANGI